MQSDNKEEQIYEKKEETQQKIDQKQQKIEESKERLDQVQEPENDKDVQFEEVKVQAISIQEIFIEDDAQKSLQFKNKGTEKFKANHPEQAISFYQKSLQYTIEENQQLRGVLHSNIGICLIKQEHWSDAVTYLKKALKYDEKYTKARLNLARCYEELDKIEEAFEQYKKLEGTQAHTQFVKDKIRVLSPKVEQINQKRKEEVMSGLKNIGNSVLGYFGLSLDNFKLQQGQGGGYNISFQQ